MQSAKGEGLAGSSFGGGGGGVGGAVFGGRGAASFLSNATSVLAIVFMLNCGVLAFMSSGTRQQMAVDVNPGESSVTRSAQEEIERYQAQQQQAQADSAAAANAVNPEDLMNPPDSGSEGN